MNANLSPAAASAAVFEAAFAAPATPVAAIDSAVSTVQVSEVLPALPTLAPVLSWTTKNGTEKRAFTATGARFAPQVAQTSHARAADLTSWKNGRFEALVKDAKAILSARQLLALTETVNLLARSKADALALCRAIVGEFPAPGMDKAPKGAKGAMLDTLRAVIDHEEEQASARALKITQQQELTTA